MDMLPNGVFKRMEMRGCSSWSYALPIRKEKERWILFKEKPPIV
jgi:hypothetical protein